jgi:hypothetical protein
MHVSSSVQPPSPVARMHEHVSNPMAMGFAIGVSR